MKKKKYLYASFIAAITISLFLIFLFLKNPKNDEPIDELYLSPDEQTELLSLQNNEYVIGILEGDEISEFIMTNITDKLQLNYTIQYYNELSLLLDDVQSGNVDFASSITFSEERSLLFDFSSPVNLQNVYLVSYDKSILENLSGKTIGVARDSIFESLLDENYYNVNVVYYDTYDEFFAMINNGEVDGSIGISLVFEDALRQGMNAVLLNDEIPITPASIITEPNINETLMSFFSRYAMTKEYQSALIQFKETFYHEINKAVLDEKMELYFINNNIELAIKFENNPPFSYYEKDGTNSGVFADTLFSICDLLEISCEVTSSSSETWGSMYNDLLSAEIDVLAPVTKTAERTQLLNFSDEILTSNYVILNRIDYDKTGYDSVYQLLYEKIGTIRNDVKHEYLRKLFPNKEFVYFDTNNDLIKGLSNGEVDYIIFNEFAYFEYIAGTRDFSIEINEKMGTLFSREICFAFPNNIEGEHLAEIFSLALEVTDVEKIINHYILNLTIADYIQQANRVNNLIIVILIVVSVSLSSTVFVFFRHNLKLRYTASHDSLLKLYNRKYYFEQLKKLNQIKYYPLGIMMLDVNGLKIINDAFGHTVGDDALKMLGNTLKSIFEEKDIVSRIGGDEFTILLPNTSAQKLQGYKDHIKAIIKTLRIENIELSLAIGYELITNASQNIDDIQKQAENHMYRHKTTEGSSVRNRAINAILVTLTDKYETERRHSAEVSHLCKLIGIEMNLREDEIKELEQAGLFHDIGKISIPDSILNKPAKLTNEEFQIIKSHTEIGYQILRAADEYSDLAIHALHHHERWDGNGYPAGLKGADIPLFSRIICVVDAYEAMTADRPYREKLSQEYAISEIIKCSGSQFDPEIAQLFVEKVLKQDSVTNEV